MKQYLDLLQHILDNGQKKEDRTGTGTISTFGCQIRFNLEEGFPIVTTKKMFIKGIIHELLWFLSGNTNIKYLVDNDVNIWNHDAYKTYKEKIPNFMKPLSYDRFIQSIKNNENFARIHGELGPIYGNQWRSWNYYEYVDNGHGGSYRLNTIDQISNVIKEIKSNPDSRRLIVSAWNVGDIPRMVLPPCHVLFQFYVNNGKLSCQLYQRSADAFLGVPFNISSYALLTMMIAHVTNLGVGEFIHTFGDIHIYLNHLEQVKTQLKRDPHPLPKMHLNPNIKNILDFKYEDFILDDYTCWPSIKGDISV